MLDGHGRTAVQHQIDGAPGLGAALPHIEPSLSCQQGPVHPAEIITGLIGSVTVELHPRTALQTLMLPVPDGVCQTPAHQVQILYSEEDLWILHRR